jgi:hypothetical protein
MERYSSAISTLVELLFHLKRPNAVVLERLKLVLVSLQRCAFLFVSYNRSEKGIWHCSQNFDPIFVMSCVSVTNVRGVFSCIAEIDVCFEEGSEDAR